LRPDDGLPSRGRCATSRLLSYVPLLASSCLRFGGRGCGFRSGRLLGRGLLRRSLGFARCLLIADRGDPQHGMILAVPVTAPVIVPAALLEDDDLVAAALGQDLGGDRQAFDRTQLRAFAGQQDVAERDRRTGV